ncbi:hypothetical protein AB2E94_25925 (plasmid) [Escherichia coli]|nr:hypothetical protein [Escherichia coli]SYX53859.1 Uncharacterised protein [Escherichia coli]SYX54007.1 Uncharacterised protein [Escherichia coli]
MAESGYGLAGLGMGKVKSINQYRLTPGFGGFTPVSYENNRVPPSMPLMRHILVTISELLYMCIYVVMTKIGQVKNLQAMQ